MPPPPRCSASPCRSNLAIATRLVITEKAVSKHTNNIFTKLDLWQDTDDNRRGSPC